METIDKNKLVKKFRDKGIIINDIFDLVNSDESCPKAIPVLLELLNANVSDDTLKEGIIRALAVKEAKGIAGKFLISEFKRTPIQKMMLLWAIGSTMDVVMSEEDIDEVINIVSNKSYGMSRQMFVSALGKFKSEEIEEVLINLLNQEEVAPHALEALGRLKSKRAENKVRSLLKHKNSLIRREAAKALEKLC